MSYSTADLIAKLAPALSEEEAVELMRVNMAIAHAINITRTLPTTLDPRARALVITKLEEADHWCLELTRIAAK